MGSEKIVTVDPSTVSSLPQDDRKTAKRKSFHLEEDQAIGEATPLVGSSSIARFNGSDHHEMENEPKPIVKLSPKGTDYTAGAEETANGTSCDPCRVPPSESSATLTRAIAPARAIVVDTPPRHEQSHPDESTLASSRNALLVLRN
ncbi:hypothetical protein BWQ96_07436 [Gracilariopsis chorda]|uniref:Uncharacterized protein n=1 Tax=Gracilariopsis chorda TaxID=448386 RepID=A0A2V3IL74_9FLOR|nr:hypothetical protein BWQ96_07436 [Gracilariopsis chorda]|eukprot:PXF42842.1 hypothetical protein BWQ96_07436 [Gracilariopsis chorda]